MGLDDLEVVDSLALLKHDLKAYMRLDPLTFYDLDILGHETQFDSANPPSYLSHLFFVGRKDDLRDIRVFQTDLLEINGSFDLTYHFFQIRPPEYGFSGSYDELHRMMENQAQSYWKGCPGILPELGIHKEQVVGLTFRGYVQEPLPDGRRLVVEKRAYEQFCTMREEMPIDYRFESLLH